MKLYLLEQNIVTGYDTFDSVVVCAENEEEARLIGPNKELESDDDRYKTWVSLKDIKKIDVTYLGEADENIKKGIIINSFNAG